MQYIHPLFTELSPKEKRKNTKMLKIEEAAWTLFKEQGFDNVTVSQIAKKSGISIRSIFRYYPIKEAILFGHWQWQIEDLVQKISRRPKSEHPFVSVSRAIMSLAEVFEKERDRILFITRLAETSAKVGSYRQQVMQPAWEEAISKALAERLDVDRDKDIRPRVWAAAAVAALDAAHAFWTVNNGELWLPDIVEQAFTALQMTGQDKK